MRALALAFLLTAPAAAQDSKLSIPRELDHPLTHVVDAPTAHALDYGGFSVRNRFFAGGGLLTWLQFGVFQRLTLGASMALDRIVGNGDNVRVNRPEIQAHIRFFDGDRWLPAFAVGFDGQGMFYDRNGKVYLERSRGLYLVASRELFLPGLQFHPGVNIADFDGEQFSGFAGVTWTMGQRVSALFEADNLGKDNRLNAGLRFHVTPFFWVDAIAREIGKDSSFTNNTARKMERVVQLKYIGSF